MTDTKIAQPAGYVSFTLHAHLPYVIHHGTWPHGLEWLLEAAAETYLPLLRIFRNLERDGLSLAANINLSPILLEQLAHPTFQAEFPNYLQRKINAAREDETLFSQTGEHAFAETARFWQRYYAQALEEFEALGRDIVGSFRYFDETGQIELITSAATHGFLPLLGNDESCIAQLKTGVTTHQRHLGKHPRGIWIPECGYRPAGLWQQPVASAESASGPSGDQPLTERIGSEEVIALAGLRYFFVDTHLVKQSLHFTPYDHHPRALSEMLSESDLRDVYRPYFSDGPLARRHPIAVFARDPQTGLQVWSGERGYPGDGEYLDFHKKRWPGGHRYWRVTDSRIDMALKEPYNPEHAIERTRVHAEHFAGLLLEAISLHPRAEMDAGRPPILSALFDAELFGHWWFEGPLWLEQVVRALARADSAEHAGVQLIRAGSYLEKYPPTGFIAMPEGSWGKEGKNDVWLNPETAWTWTHIYGAEERVRAIASKDRWRDGGLGERIVKQLCRELLLLESSDWQFLITTESARDYAEARFTTHLDQLKAVESVWHQFETTAGLSHEAYERLRAIEDRDNIFPDIDPGLWAKRETPER
jgi:1,4-alpha-glucan branching enzyme